MTMAKAKLGNVTTSALRTELDRRARGLDRLETKREKLLEQLEDVEIEIETLSSAIGAGAPTGRKKKRGTRRGAGGSKTTSRKRPRNDMNLVDALAKVLKTKTMGVTEVSDAVQKAGYKTSSPNFRTIVNQTLINSGKFKRVSRGQYTAK